MIVCKLLDLGNILPLLKNPILLTENCTVLVACFVSEVFMQYVGLVYLPTLRRKKKVIVYRFHMTFCFASFVS